MAGSAETLGDHLLLPSIPSSSMLVIAQVPPLSVQSPPLRPTTMGQFILASVSVALIVKLAWSHVPAKAGPARAARARRVRGFMAVTSGTSSVLSEGLDLSRGLLDRSRETVILAT